MSSPWMMTGIPLAGALIPSCAEQLTQSRGALAHSSRALSRHRVCLHHSYSSELPKIKHCLKCHILFFSPKAPELQLLKTKAIKN